MPQVKLRSSDNEVFDVDIEVARLSVTIKKMLEEGTNETIPLHNVNSRILRKVIEWATYHKDDPPVEDRPFVTMDIPQWDQDFLDIDQGTLFELMQAAHYLDLKGLLLVLSQTVANTMMGKRVEEVREMYNIKNDFTPEEEAAIREQTRWAWEQQ